MDSPLLLAIQQPTRFPDQGNLHASPAPLLNVIDILSDSDEVESVRKGIGVIETRLDHHKPKRQRKISTMLKPCETPLTTDQQYSNLEHLVSASSMKASLASLRKDLSPELPTSFQLPKMHPEAFSNINKKRKRTTLPIVRNLLREGIHVINEAIDLLEETYMSDELEKIFENQSMDGVGVGILKTSLKGKGKQVF